MTFFGLLKAIKPQFYQKMILRLEPLTKLAFKVEKRPFKSLTCIFLLCHSWITTFIWEKVTFTQQANWPSYNPIDIFKIIQFKVQNIAIVKSSKQKIQKYIASISISTLLSFKLLQNFWDCPHQVSSTSAALVMGWVAWPDIFN